MSPVTLNCLVAGENSYENDLKLITDIIFNDKAAAQFMLYQRNLGVADSYDQLTCIEIGSSATPEEISNSAIEDFLIHKASLPITSANEATGCEFISAIIYGVASIFDGTVKVIPKLQTTPNQMNRDLERTFAIDTTIYIVKCKPTLLDASGHPGTDMFAIDTKVLMDSQSKCYKDVHKNGLKSEVETTPQKN
ncbi:hypothetical protein RhiirA5_417965 [Rhizophagus irregularis]|uniref:Uncharacterized protein n=1 Tax=Rhizophagus irregularis TaxID=588596 RepID=A0A2N0PLF8_9GLOM|nr:hypothetical protein RhiirA5_417965 [Rhizophagus irregularis]